MALLSLHHTSVAPGPFFCLLTVHSSASSGMSMSMHICFHPGLMVLWLSSGQRPSEFDGFPLPACVGSNPSRSIASPLDGTVHVHCSRLHFTIVILRVLVDPPPWDVHTVPYWIHGRPPASLSISHTHTCPGRLGDRADVPSDGREREQTEEERTEKEGSSSMGRVFLGPEESGGIRLESSADRPRRHRPSPTNDWL